MNSRTAQRQLRAAKSCVDELRNALALDHATRDKRYGAKTVELLAGEAWFHLLSLEHDLARRNIVEPSDDQ
jgi:hypothetical protein